MRNPVALAAWLLGTVVGVVLIVFVVSNRGTVVVSLAPYPREYVVPVFLLVVTVFGIGALFGGIFVWLRAHTERRLSARRKRTIKTLEKELGRSRNEIVTLKSTIESGNEDAGLPGQQRTLPGG